MKILPRSEKMTKSVQERKAKRREHCSLQLHLGAIKYGSSERETKTAGKNNKEIIYLGEVLRRKKKVPKEE